VFIDADSTASERLANCWLYLFWYSLRGEGGWTCEAYVDEMGLYHQVELSAHRGKDARPHAAPGTDGLLLPLTDRRGKDAASVFHVPLVSPFQIPWARLPRVPVDKTLSVKSPEFQTLFDWLAKKRDILGSACVAAGLGRENGMRVARFRSAWHSALALGWDVAVAQRELATVLQKQPNLGKLLVLHHMVDAVLKSGTGARFIDKEAFEQDRSRLRRFADLQEEIERRGQKLARHVQGISYSEMIGDMNATGGEAYWRFMEALAPVYDVLPSIPEGDAHLDALFGSNTGLLTDKNYKAARKSAKAVWAFFKAAIKVATDQKLKPLRAAIVDWASHALSMRIQVDEHGLLHAQTAKGFESTIVDHDLAHKAFILMDAYNLIVALKDLEKEWKSEGLRTPKAFSAAAAAFSLVGTTAGWRESTLKRLKNARGEKLWKGAKNVLGTAGNVADAVGSGWQAYKEFETDDSDAAVAQIVSGVGAGTQAVGYALAFFGVAAAPIVLMVGAALAAGGTVAYVLADNDDLEDWLNHCWWGCARGEKSSGVKKWSEGPLSSFHQDLDKQMRALSRIFFDFEVKWDYRPVDPVFNRDRRQLRLILTFARIPDGAKVWVRVVGRRGGADELLRPGGVWHSAVVERDSGEQSTRMWEDFDGFHYDEVIGEVRLDIYGDGMQMLPPSGEDAKSARFRVPLIERVVGSDVPTWT
jgi:hypothetical protein